MPLSSRALAGALVAVLATAGRADAHAHLRSATPAEGGVVAVSPPALSLDFSEGLELGFSGAAVNGPDGKPVATGPAALAPGGKTTLVVPVAAPLTPGTYTVTWHALSTDGHKTGGSYRFTVRP